jgi:Zn-dependent protease/CBS domain-containing protein
VPTGSPSSWAGGWPGKGEPFRPVGLDAALRFERRAHGQIPVVNATFKLGRVAGIDVGVNWTWIIVVALVVWSLAAGVFPNTNPDLSDETYLVMAAIAAVLFFLSIFLHELGHAVQAQREGMEIDGIVLWVFGGVARFKGEFPSAGAEFRIAIAGPAVSLALGVGFLGLSFLGGLPSAADGVVFWVGQINLILLVFNMLPALPLDGGRVLRSILWHVRGDFGAATRAAAGLGRLFGQIFIVGGLMLVIFVGAFAGLWLAFIGFFLLAAAESEGQMSRARTALSGLRVRDVMIDEPVVAEPSQTLERFLDEIFFETRHTTYPVARHDGRALGLVSFRSVTNLPREEWPMRRVEEVMVPLEQALVLSGGEELEQAFPKLMQAELNRALVCDGDRLVGLLSITDTARVLEVRGQAVRAGALEGRGAAAGTRL